MEPRTTDGIEHQRAHARRYRSRRNSQFGRAQWTRVEELLKEEWSPEQVSGHLGRTQELVIIRESLDTPDEARAELLRERIDHEVALLDPRFQAVELPPRVREIVAERQVVGAMALSRV